jgi:hypothetical protein
MSRAGCKRSGSPRRLWACAAPGGAYAPRRPARAEVSPFSQHWDPAARAVPFGRFRGRLTLVLQHGSLRVRPVRVDVEAACVGAARPIGPDVEEREPVTAICSGRDGRGEPVCDLRLPVIEAGQVDHHIVVPAVEASSPVHPGNTVARKVKSSVVTLSRPMGIPAVLAVKRNVQGQDGKCNTRHQHPAGIGGRKPPIAQDYAPSASIAFSLGAVAVWTAH